MNVRKWFAPSIIAASVISRGSAWKKPTSTSTAERDPERRVDDDQRVERVERSRGSA